MACCECLKKHECYSCKTTEGGSYCKLPWICFDSLMSIWFLKQLLLESCDFAKSFLISLSWNQRLCVSDKLKSPGWGEDGHSHASCSSGESCCLHLKGWHNGSGSNSGTTTIYGLVSVICTARLNSVAIQDSLFCKWCSHHCTEAMTPVGREGPGRWEYCPLHLFDLNLLPPKTQQWGGLGFVLQSCWCFFVFS